MKKYKSIGIAMLVAAFLAGFVFHILFSAPVFSCGAFAEQTNSEETNAEEAEGETSSNALVDSFIAQLKAKYGDEYEKYYNAIIEKWGSIEAYLLDKISDETNDPVANSWRAVMEWLHEYSPIWASILAVAGIAVVFFGFRFALVKLLSWLDQKKNTVYKSINTVFEAQHAQNRAILKLLGNNPNTADERAIIEEAQRKLEEEYGDG